MAQQQPIRLQVEKKGGCFSGCGTAFAVLLLIGLAVKYWCIAVSILVLAAVIGLVVNAQKRHRPAWTEASSIGWQSSVGFWPTNDPRSTANGVSWLP